MVQCSHCNSEAPAGTRWCSVCHHNLSQPQIGALASPFRRLMAAVLDSIVLFVVLGAAFMSGLTVGGGSLALLGEPVPGQAPSSAHYLALSSIFVVPAVLLLVYAVWALLEFRQGKTPGKRLVRIRVVREDGSAPGFLVMLLREWVGKWLSSFFFGLGLFWILFDKENQGWHDKLLRTYVVGGGKEEARESG